MIIYKTTNLINGKIYIGKTVGTKKNYIGSGTAFKKATKKYGKENFKCEIIIQGNFNRDLISQLEKHYIRLYASTFKKIGYNISPGGSESDMAYKLRKIKKHKIFINKRNWVESILIGKIKE